MNLPVIIKRKTYFQKPCPYCGEYVSMLELIRVRQGSWNTLSKSPKTICPQCGKYIASNFQKSPWLGASILLFVSIALLDSFGIEPSTKGQMSPIGALIAIAAGLCLFHALKYSQLIATGDQVITVGSDEDANPSNDVLKADKKQLFVAVAGGITFISIFFFVLPWMNGHTFFLRCHKYFGIKAAVIPTLLIFSLIPILVFGCIIVPLFKQGIRVMQSKQFPPPGPKVHQFTPLKKGSVAQAYGIVQLLLSALLVVVLCFEVYYSYRIIEVFSKPNKNDLSVCHIFVMQSLSG